MAHHGGFSFPVIVLLCIVYFTGCIVRSERLRCESSGDSEGEVINGTEYCRDDRYFFCMVVWSTRTLEDNSTVADVIKRGCFKVVYEREHYDHPCKPNCTQQRHFDSMAKSKNVSGFCCCSTDYCNRNFTMVTYEDEIDVSATKMPGNPTSYSSNITVVVGIVLATLMLITVMVLCYWFQKKRTKLQYSRPDTEEKDPQGPTLDLSQLHLGELIGRGRYGTVWKATMFKEVMAVKVFIAEHRIFWQAERDLYAALEQHPEILRFFAACDRPTQTSPEYLLLTEYHPRGSLLDYLRQSVVTWKEMCVMGCSMASGLAYMHQDEVDKPAFVHRDFNSKNVLVKLDGTCVLADFGFAMNVSEATKPADDGTLITEVGTLRYMAPEVLDGAVNLHDIQGALKQIDIYALSIVLWEVAMRCEEIFGRDQVPEFKSPFEAELGPMITSEDMHTYVVQKKLRPGFQDTWKSNHSGLRFLKETIEDSWDQDGDARLLALCIKDRLSDLMNHYPTGLMESSNTPTVPVQQFQQNFTPDVPEVSKNQVIVTMDENQDSGTVV